MIIEVYVMTNKINSKCTDTFEVDDDEWNAMSEEERADMCRDATLNLYEWGWDER